MLLFKVTLAAVAAVAMNAAAHEERSAFLGII